MVDTETDRYLNGYRHIYIEGGREREKSIYHTEVNTTVGYAAIVFQTSLSKGARGRRDNGKQHGVS